MVRTWAGITLTTLTVLCGLGAHTTLRAARDASLWESQIAEYEAADRDNPPEAGTIVFTGSSSVRLWESLAEDMAPLRVLNRGFGGAHMSHVNHFAHRIILPYDPSAVVVYAGDNDLAAGTGKTPESVLADFEELIGIVRRALPSAPIYYITVKPSTLREDRWPIQNRLNGLIADLARRLPAVEVIDTSRAMLDSAGKPRPELLVADGLHMNAEGYALWTSIIRPRLEARFGPP